MITRTYYDEESQTLETYCSGQTLSRQITAECLGNEFDTLFSMSLISSLPVSESYSLGYLSATSLH